MVFSGEYAACATSHASVAQQGVTGVSIGGYRMTSATQLQSATPAKRILVVEDELMIRMLLEDMLGELGYTVAAEAARIEEALEAAKNADFDIAILDVNLNGQPISPVADALVARGMPFVFATGYGERGLPEPYRDRPTLKKPFQMDGLKQMLQTALDRGKN
jgi:CheY-like chemotaxis protein